MTNKKRNKSNKKPQPKKVFPWKKILLIGLSSVISLILLVVLIIWVIWPVRSKDLQTTRLESFSFNEAKSKIVSIQDNERSIGVKTDCLSHAYIHETPTNKAVTMFHGVSDCPRQFSTLGKYFYERGYNVYIPRVPHHGMPDNLEHSKVSAQELVDYVNNSTNITNALGKEKGIVGLSGGGNLGTWATEYRPEVSRFLALAPFYEPASKQAPKWQIRPLLVFHGNNLIPDQLNDPKNPQSALSYRALAKYTTIFNNLQNPPKDTGLKKLSLIMADDDDQIDQDLALKTLNRITTANRIPLGHYQIPASYGVKHDIVGLRNKKVAEHQDFLYAKYFELYDN